MFERKECFSVVFGLYMRRVGGWVNEGVLGQCDLVYVDLSNLVAQYP